MAPQVRDFYFGDSNASTSKQREIRNRVQAFTTSAEFAQLIARPAESDPNLQVMSRMETLFVFLILSVPFLLVSLAYFQWFPELHGWWWLPPFVLLGVFPASVASLHLMGVLTQVLEFESRVEYDKIAVGVIEKLYISDATKNDASEGHFEVSFTTAENDRVTVQYSKVSPLKMVVGDVGLAILPHDFPNCLVGFWRSKSFSL